MRKSSILVASSVVCFVSSALAQQPTAIEQSPAATRPTQAPLQIPNPHYVSIPMSVDVNVPVDRLWARIGRFCDYGEWAGNGGPNTCRLTSGSDFEFGATRSVANEVEVAVTQYSYTYAQVPHEGIPYNLYHGTVEAQPLTSTTSRVIYTLFFDNSMLADDAAREADIISRRTRFSRSLGNMKILAEGGALPAPPQAEAMAPAAPRPATAPLMSPVPRYIAVPMTITVNAPVDQVWKRIGKFCDIGEWGIPGCTLKSGTDGEFGAVRSIGNEVLVAKTKYSYTYTQPLRATGGYLMYNGTLEARALTASTTQINYTLLYDNSAIAEDARAAEMQGRRTRFSKMLLNMKTLCEGGTLAPDALSIGRGSAAAPATPR